ncbi:TetR/AcrR family transcriptional regulator [Xanthomonas citri]|uniref:TetR/AcrR family transcriptional regulator n=1 Tax=Xanthomonas citri TaxID=346 RepID=UPI000B5CF97E|nr:TetR/AcrR family transcriptional regulator [Xanthomonas citri]ASL02649.1 TetR family transcriptional regulator [Xanthomonas citri pv. vignicola]
MSTTKSRPRAPLKAPAPRLTGNKLPAQHRATETYEHILAVTAQLLGDVGVERLSTNLVCAHAGLTPPALYRYFPNKYALLSELGTRLMQRQNALVPKWITPQAMSGSREQVQQALTGLVLDTYRVTKATEGGVWILRALRAVPALQQVRLDSHAQVTRAQVRMLADFFPDADPRQLRLVSRIVVDLIYATVELLFDVRLSSRAVAETVGTMIAGHVEQLRDATADVPKGSAVEHRRHSPSARRSTRAG